MEKITYKKIKNGFARRIKKLRNLQTSEQKFISAKRTYQKLSAERSFSNSYDFVNRSKGSENLLLILAGFQEFYWEGVLARVKQNQEQFDEDIDVCICVPGANGKILKKMAEKYSWSYLRIAEDLLAQAQNTAISLHSNAKWIYKIDEDIIISNNYFRKLKDNYLLAQEKMNTKVGLISPLINVNACSIETFLSSIGMMQEFEETFGKLKIGMEEPIHKNPEVAKWIWEKSVPFNEIATKIEKMNSGKLKVCSYRLSIGAILFTREFWEELGYFKVAELESMGAEEEQVNAYCINKMYNIVLAEDTLAGHLGFFFQKAVCKQFYEENIKKIIG